MLTAALGAEAQPAGRVFGVGVLIQGGPAPNSNARNPGPMEFDAFVHRMRELGYVPDQNLIVETRGADGS